MIEQLIILAYFNEFLINLNLADTNRVTPVLFPRNELARLVDLTQTLFHYNLVVPMTRLELLEPYLEAAIVPEAIYLLYRSRCFNITGSCHSPQLYMNRTYVEAIVKYPNVLVSNECSRTALPKPSNMLECEQNEALKLPSYLVPLQPVNTSYVSGG